MKSQPQPVRLEENLGRSAAANPDAPAIVSTSYQPVTRAQLAGQIAQVARAFGAAGLGRSSRVAVAIRDPAPAALAIVSVACAAAAVPLDPNLVAAEAGARLQLLGVAAVCVLAGETTAVRTAAEERGLAIIELTPQAERALPFAVSPPRPRLPRLPDAPSLDGVAVILQTSGTTAEPKLVPCTHVGLLAAAERARAWFNLGPHDRCLSLSPPHYSHGLTFTILAPLLTGGSVAFPASPNRVDLAEWLEALAPTWYSASPTVHLAMSEWLGSAGTGVKHRLRLASSGGMPLPEQVRENLERALGVPVLEHYGMSEACQISSNLPHPGPCRAGTVGIPPAGTVMVAGADGERVAPGHQGEIWVRGPTVTPGYLNGQEANRAAFAGEWLRTGDLGSLDADGFLRLHGRIKELINRGGEKLSPAEIEAALLAHPDVREAAAFAVPHPRLGEDVGAAVVLRPGATAAAGDIRQFAGARLSWTKVPRRIQVRESLPRGPGGKVLRNNLRESWL